MSDKEGEVGQLFVDLAEALSALGNYLGALNQMAHSQAMQAPERFGEALEKSIAQYERAADAARRLRTMSVLPPDRPLVRC